MFEHIQGYLHLYQALVGKQSGAIVAEHMQQMIADLVRDELATLAPRDDVTPIPIELVVQYTVSAFLGLLIWWADHDGPYPAAQMDAIFQQLTLPGVLAGLGRTDDPASSGDAGAQRTSALSAHRGCTDEVGTQVVERGGSITA